MSGQGQKMKAFNINPVGRRSKQIKQKKEDEEKAAAEAFEEFVATFEEPPTAGKLFVRGTVINAGSGEEKQTAQTGKLYKPPKLVELPKKEDGPPPPKPQPPKPKASYNQKHENTKSSHYKAVASSEKTSKKKEQEKKKSNLELFKEELKIIQEEREERHRLKNALKDSKDDPFDSQLRLADDYRLPNSGSYDTGDPNTTNIYLGNLNPKMSEQELCELFGRFGPLASVKIMWPRSEEERSRGKNCGFVAYMNRKDGERAMKTLNNQEIQGFEMKLGWGKAVPIPPHPIYIPPALQELTLPPPPSGLPFNAQPEYQPTEEELRDHFEEILANSVVKVVIPGDRNLLMLIHRMIEFVVREGPMFEAMIMNREINNPMFRFLYENQTPAHVYYRWRLFSILQGEHPNKWRQEEFFMFEGGSIWRPPPMNPYLMGMPESLVIKSLKPDPKKGALTDSQRDQLEDLLRNLIPDRNKIAEAMMFCIENAECAEEVMECIFESLSIPETPLYRKVARIYLISDILHNCTVKVNNASFYRKGFEGKLPDIFKEIRICFKNIEGRLKAEQFKQRVMNCFRAWEDWAIYPNEFLIRLQNIFLGLEGEGVDVEVSEPVPVLPERDSATDSDLDGLPLAPEELDGVPIADDHLDIDGMPLADDLDGQPFEEELPPQPPQPKAAEKEFQAKFKPSKWEIVDPETMAAQAITTSKWDLLDQQDEKEEEEEEENAGSDIDGEPMDPSLFEGPKLPEEVKSSPASSHSTPADALLESVKADIQAERRAKLRDIEVKVMKFQDELESGKRSRKAGMTIADQVEHYRKKLLRKEREKLQEEVERERRVPSPQASRSPPSSGEASPIYPSPKIGLRSPDLRKRSRSRSPRPSKSHRVTLSPKRHHRSRSRSPKRRRSRSRSPGYRSRSPTRKSHKSSKRSKY